MHLISRAANKVRNRIVMSKVEKWIIEIEKMQREN